MSASPAIARVLVGYGSESGNARALAQRLGTQAFLQPYGPAVLPLDEVDPASLGPQDALLIVCSSFGDGEPPGNAERFLEALTRTRTLPHLRYAVFGLGDTAYPRFCGFSKTLDALLAERLATALINRVDADANYAAFFERWLPVLEQVLGGDLQAGRELTLQVKAYGESDAFAAEVLERRRLSASDPAAWHVRLDIAGSGIVYRAGDTLHVVPENDEDLLGRLASWYGQPDAATVLRYKELRQIGKPLLRELARLGGSETLKGLTKVSQRAALEAYLYGADLLDVLEDHCTPDTVPLASLAELLPGCLPRAYSIASRADADSLDLCVREVRYTRGGRVRNGACTGWLLSHRTERVRIFSRANPGFYLPPDTGCPLILIGTGTGVAPLMGLMREAAASDGRREICLIFGEKRSDQDFLYRDELEALRDGKVLDRLITAFSRDTDAKYYVQDAMAEHGDYLSGLLRRDAHIYLCGNKRHLEGAVEQAVSGLMEADAAQQAPWRALSGQGRLHRELY